MSGPRRTRALLAGWAAVIILLSVLPLPPSPRLPFKFLSPDTLAHALFYMPLGALLYWSFPAGRRWVCWARAAGAAFAFGAGLEIIQGLLPFRDFDWGDGLANLIGGMVGAAGAMVLPSFSFYGMLAKSVRDEGEAAPGEDRADI